MIGSVSVPVPYSGDGPAVDVSALVGPKTVQLSGTYEGYYDLLGSQDGQTFAPIASFSAGGPEGIEQTIPGAFSSVKLRSGATGAAGVVCEVSGISGAGENGFGVVASLEAGASGLTPVVDAATFVPPTGPEMDACFLCGGAFSGPIVVLGSIDGVEFNPLGAWNPGKIPQGAPLSQELAPLVTEAKVRYVRLLVSGVVTGATTVTMGGTRDAVDRPHRSHRPHGTHRPHRAVGTVRTERSVRPDGRHGRRRTVGTVRSVRTYRRHGWYRRSRSRGSLWPQRSQRPVGTIGRHRRHGRHGRDWRHRRYRRSRSRRTLWTQRSRWPVGTIGRHRRNRWYGRDRRRGPLRSVRSVRSVWT